MPTLSTAARDAGIAAIAALLNNGDIQFYSSVPTLLVTCDFGATAFGAPSTGVVTANAISPGTAVASGDAVEARLRNSGGDVIITATAGIDSGSPDFSFGDTAGDNAIVEDGTVTVNALTMTLPAS